MSLFFGQSVASSGNVTEGVEALTTGVNSCDRVRFSKPLPAWDSGTVAITL